MRFKALCILFVALLAIVPMTGCQSAAEKATKGATGVEVDTDDNKVTVTGEDGEQVEIQSGDELPDEFPDDVPMYDDAKIMASNKYSAEGKTTFTVAYEVSADVKDVFDWYKEELQKDDWKIEGESLVTAQDQSTGAMGATKGERQANVAVTAGDDDSKTTVSVTVIE